MRTFRCNFAKFSLGYAPGPFDSWRYTIVTKLGHPLRNFLRAPLWKLRHSVHVDSLLQTQVSFTWLHNRCVMLHTKCVAKAVNIKNAWFSSCSAGFSPIWPIASNRIPRYPYWPIHKFTCVVPVRGIRCRRKSKWTARFNVPIIIRFCNVIVTVFMVFL